MAVEDQYITPKFVEALLRCKNDVGYLAERLDPNDPISMRIDLESVLKRVMRAYDIMPERKRERIEMYLWSGMTQIEQANYFNTSQPNIKRDFKRALKTLLSLVE